MTEKERQTKEVDAALQLLTNEREIEVAMRFYTMATTHAFKNLEHERELARNKRPIVIPLTCRKCGYTAEIPTK